MSIKHMVNQVKALKKERETKMRIKPAKNGGVVVSKEERFKYDEKFRKEQESMPGPGYYNTVH